MRAFFVVLLGVAAIFRPALAGTDGAPEASLAGNWRGETTLGAREIAFEASFEKGGEWSGTMQLLGINSRPLQLEDISIQGDTVSFRLPATSRSSGGTAAGGTTETARGGFLFSGRIEGREIVGTMAVGPLNSAMKMFRED